MMLLRQKLKLCIGFALFVLVSNTTSQAQQVPLQNCRVYEGLYRVCEGDGLYQILTPEIIIALSDSLAAERQRLEGQLQLAVDLSDLSLFNQTQAELRDPARLTQEHLVAGQLALIAAQAGHFAFLQDLLQKRNPWGDISITPYTDGTIDIAVNGENHTHKTIDVLRGLFQDYANSDGTPRFY